MDKIFVKDSSQYLNQEITAFFVANQKELREGTKDFYVRLSLVDRTGSVNGNIWNNAKHFAELFKEGDIVKVKAMVISYKGQVQLTVSKIRTAEETEYDLTDFVAASEKDVNLLSEQFFGYIDSINDTYIKALMLSIFEDKEYFQLFAQSPAAKQWHHNYIGGLLEHTVSVARICDFMSHYYPVDRDILIAGALLHDMGKVYEYFVKTTIDFSDLGRLVGHISIADQIVVEKSKAINAFPAVTLMKLRHLILSHHGEIDKGAVKVPQTIEAVALNCADNMDAQTVGVKQLIEGTDKAQTKWTEYDKLNNRYVYVG